MPYFYWSGQSTVYRATGYSDVSPRNTISIPLGRQSYLLTTGGTNNPIWVQQVKMYLGGRGGTRTASIVVGNSTSANFSLTNVGTTGEAYDVGFKDVAYKYSGTTAASISVGYNTNGSTFFGRYGTTADTATLWGRCFYVQVPTGPTTVSASSPSAGTLRVSWNAPSDDGGSAIDGYYVQVSTTSSFSSITTFADLASSSTSYDFSGLTSGTTYYARVFAYNATHYEFQNYPMSIASSTVSAVIAAPPTPAWTTDFTLATAQINSAYSTSVSATNTDSYSKVSGDSWISVSSSGTVSGTAPSSVGTSSVTIRATGTGGSADRTFSVPVDGPAPSWNTASALSNVNVSTYYSTQLSATNATSYEKLSGGSNDSWISVSSSGLVTGTSPSSPASVSFTVRASGNGKTSDRTFSLSVVQPAPSWNTGTTLPSGQQNVAYSTTVSASNTTSYSKLSGDSWIAVSSSGVLSGTPTVSGTATVSIRATGPTGLTADRTFSILVESAPVPVWTTTSPLPSVVVGSAYNTSVSATNTQTYSKLSGGTNDSWVTVSSLGQVYGSPPTVGTTIVKIRATSSLGIISDKDFTITVTSPLPAWVTSATLTGGKANVAYSATVVASNTDSYAISGSAPSWLSLNTTTGQISGTPTADGTYTVTIIPTGPGGVGPSRTFSISIASASPSWIDSQLQNSTAVINQPYSDGFSASNVNSSSAYLITGLPNGLTYNSTTGAISGSPTQTGQFSISATAFGIDGTTINTSGVLNVFYPGERKGLSGSWSQISQMQRFNGSSWVPVQFVKRKTSTGWIDASN